MALKHEGDVKSYDSAFLDCRASQHDWYLAGYFKAGRGFIGRRSWCERCDTIRTDIWTTDGERVKGKYDYSDGYQIAHNGSSPASKQDFRRELLRRVRSDVYASEEQLLAQRQ